MASSKHHSLFSVTVLLSLLTNPSSGQGAAQVLTFEPLGSSPTDTASFTPPPEPTGYAEPDPGPNFANYYYVLIGLVITFLILTFFAIRRSRRRNYLRQQAGAPPPTPYANRFHRVLHPLHPTVVDSRVEEGLNERGEAPPPYIPGESSSAGGQGVPLQDLSGKPPDYEAHINGDGEDLMRAPPVHYPDERRGSPASPISPVSPTPPDPSTRPHFTPGYYSAVRADY
jgi:hypothetical protein